MWTIIIKQLIKSSESKAFCVEWTCSYHSGSVATASEEAAGGEGITVGGREGASKRASLNERTSPACVTCADMITNVYKTQDIKISQEDRR